MMVSKPPSLGHASQPGSILASVGQTSDSLIPGRSSTAGPSQHHAVGDGTVSMALQPAGVFWISYVWSRSQPGECVYAKMGGITPSLSGNVPQVVAASPTATNGVPSDSLAEIEIISPQLRRDIIKGTDVNLSTLLIPGYNPDGDLRHIVSNGDVYPIKNSDSRLL